MNKIYNGIVLQGIHIKKQRLLNYYSYQAITVYSEILHSQTVTLTHTHTRIKGCVICMIVCSEGSMHVQQQLKNLTNITVKDVGYVLKSITAHYKQFTFTKGLRLIIKIKYQQSKNTIKSKL